MAHRRAGTVPHGTVRASFGYGNDAASADLLVDAVDRMSGKAAA
jgi:hypothetical protein